MSPFSDAPIGGLHKQSRSPLSLSTPGRARSLSFTTRGVAKGGAQKPPKQRYLCQDCGEDFGQFHGQCPGCKAWESFVVFTVEKGGSSGANPTGGGGAGARALARAAANAPAIRSSGDAYDGGSRQTTTAPAPAAAPARKGAGSRASRGGWVADAGAPRRLHDVLSPDAVAQRLPRVTLPGELGAEVERVLGGGVVPGAMLLIGGDPGVGKSTLALQIAGLLGEQARLREKKNGQHKDSDPGTGATVLYASGEESVEQLASRAERLGVNAEVGFGSRF